jgi:peptidoglycan/LPS O-acetylase OafA/YrhL
MTTHRPNWLPAYIPEFQGLRGLAILAVVIFHCHALLEGTRAYYPSLWGWAGVDLFFVLSGYLVTTILLEERGKPNFLKRFYMRRALHIVPVYLLILILCYTVPDWFLGDTWAHQTRWQVIVGYLCFVQNLRHSPLPGTLGPTWFLSVVVQFYVVWALVMRFVRHIPVLALMLVAMMVTSPLLRHYFWHFKWMNSTHTLIHMDGIALGSLMALGIYTLGISKNIWIWIGSAAAVLGFAAAATVAGGTPLLDSAIALGFGGVVLLAMTTSGARNPINWLLSHGPLAFYGTISYGLYLCHILVFVYYGSFNSNLELMGVPGHLIIFGLRLLAATVFGTLLYYGVESQFMKLKRYF